MDSCLNNFVMDGHKLPSEILVRVFTHLDLRSRAAAERTCRRWHDLMKCTFQPPIGLYVGSKNNFDHYPPPAYLSGENEYYTWDAYSVSETKVVSFLVNNNRGRALFLQIFSKELLHKCLTVIDTEWHQLENLKIHYFYGIDDDELNLTGYALKERITHLKASYADPGDEFIEHIFKTCTNIESLALPSARETRPSTFRTLPDGLRALCVPSLSALHETMDSLFDGNIEQILHFCFQVCDAVELLQICTKMSHLITFSVTLADGEPPESVRPIAQLLNLRNLRFESSEKNLEGEFLAILAKCPNLRSLAVNGGFITPSFIRALPATVPQLKELGLLGDYYDHNYSKAMHNLLELAQMVHLESLELVVDHEYIDPVVCLVQNSTSLRNFDFGTGRFGTNNLSLVRLWNAMIEKANVNQSKTFQFRICGRPQSADTVPENLIVYHN